MESLESEMNLQQYWLILKRRRWPILFVFIFVFSATTLVGLLKKPVYLGEGDILVKRPNYTPSLTTTEQEQVPRDFQPIDEGNSALNTEKEIITSVPMIYTTSLTSNERLSREFEPIDEKNSSPLNTEKEIITSTPMIKKTIKALDLRNEKGILLRPQQLLNNLTVQQVSNADILSISYQHTDPERAASVVNTLIDVYLKRHIVTNQLEAKNAREFLEKQLPQAKAKVEEKEMALRKFKEENGLFTQIENQADSAEAIISDLDQKIIQIRSEYADINHQIATLRNNLNNNSQEPVDITSLNQSFFNGNSDQSSDERQLLEQLQQLESELAIQRTRLTQANPMLASLETEVEAIKKQLLGKLEAKRKNLANQLATLSQEKSSYKQQLSSLPSLDQQQQKLERQLEVAQSQYSKILEDIDQFRFEENRTIGNVEVLSPAPVPEKPVAPRKSLFLVAGLLLASLLSVATALILETKDKSIRTIDNAKALMQVPLLGVIPMIGKSKKAILLPDDLDDSNRAIVAKNDNFIRFSEAYQKLLNNLRLRLSKSDHKIKVMAVTSSIAQEGKSTVSANLALTMARQGKKVLLVDADLLCPKQHEIHNLSNQVGLTNILVGKIQYQAAIQKLTNNLDVLTAGEESPDPIALLDSQTMTSLIEQFSIKFKAAYDYVIIDSPPLTASSDALVLGKIADGILLVVRPRLIDAVGMNIAKELLQESQQNVLGLVFNGIVPDDEPHQYYTNTYYRTVLSRTT
jgi:capsular exopolysaccharide synthesis family protein